MLKGIFNEKLNSLNLYSDEGQNLINRNYRLKGLSGSSIAFAAQSLFQLYNKNLLLIASEKERAAYLLNDLEALLTEEKTLPTGRQVLFFPESFRNVGNYESTENANVQERAAVLNLISKENFNGIIVTYPEAIAEKVTLKKKLEQNTLQIRKGERLSIDFISEFLREFKFQLVDFVYEPGQFSIRGGIVDIFSFANEFPYRIEFFGNEVDAIKSFDPVNQLSNARFDFITIIPNINSSVFDEEKGSILNYFSKENLFVCLEDLELTLEVCDKLFSEYETHFEKEHHEIKQTEPEKLFLQKEEFISSLKNFSVFEYGIRSALQGEEINFNQIPQPSFNKKFDLLFEHLLKSKKNSYTNFLITSNGKQSERLFNIFRDLSAKQNIEEENIITHLPVDLHEGFVDHDLKIALFTDHQIFERYHRFKLRENKTNNAQAFTIKELMMLNPGDYVVHIDHGIGRFAGLHKTNNNGKIQEHVKILYKDNDFLFVNIHSLHRISKYSGKEGQVPRIDKLGSNTWNNLKKKTKSKVKELAFDLLKLYAQRKSKPGHAFAGDNYLQYELEASFIFEDTPDQIRVTQDVKRDMEKPHPMDRLVCGDVGFGKTEIAIRAAFKAVCDGKQVAVLVPTTILAYQHFKTFSERLKDLPCTVDYISRFRNTKDKKEITKKITEGKIDIIIGTHKLVGKEIKFKDLGLMIIDEEQKFGVGVKDKLKLFKADVDTLTLTATPIPRTLQFSLIGARDLSVISTPPPNRYPVQTSLNSYSEELIRDAVHYELSRGGQVFFVHNKVSSILDMAGVIQRLVPRARVAIGHGQMDGDKLEEVVLGFMEGDFDVLVATTIIENGLDISNANTIIINEAQNFGLSDLHQLRGRVGRSNRKAFCYLLAPSQLILTEEARKRLKALVDFSELGSGFQIAMRDLDIRGAGNLLGAEQSGFINDMGFDTYMKILNEAVEELKEENKELYSEENLESDKSVFSRQFVKETVVDTDMQLLIPENYLSSLTERLLLYRELDNISNEKDLQAFENNLRDRFGIVPNETIELINIVRLRWQAMRAGFERLTLKNNKMLAYFIAKKESEYFAGKEFQAVIKYVHIHKHRCILKEVKEKLFLTVEDVNSVKDAAEVLEEMMRLG